MVPAPRIALVGFMGSGKTEVGRILAKKIGYQFVDFDEVIEEETGLSIREIFEKHGEKYFRRKEKEILRRFSKESNMVAATGGGIIEDEENRKELKENWFTVFLNLPFEIAYQRIKEDINRPKARGKREEVESLFYKRESLYKEASHLVVYTKDLSAFEVASYIAKRLGE